MNRSYYSSTIAEFVNEPPHAILGRLAENSEFAVEPTQRDAWTHQIQDLQEVLANRRGRIYFEYAIPRMGKRVDVVVVCGPAVFVIEYKVGEVRHTRHAIHQVTDYALDLKNFHEPSHDAHIVPVLIATNATDPTTRNELSQYKDRLFRTIRCNQRQLGRTIEEVLSELASEPDIDNNVWNEGRYSPTPTIIEAATALYQGHNVTEISRSDAGGAELLRTTKTISDLISRARQKSFKAVCFVTGVPGAGKTLIGLNVATEHLDRDNGDYSVFLSGNGPLVKILQEALARDKVEREHTAGRQKTKGEARSEAKLFIQNVHHYRDECLADPNPPFDHVAIFDEAQRAWDSAQTSKFMRTKKGRGDFDQSEPEFLLSCIDRHDDWGVVVCLVGGGQEINTGEAGIGEWISALDRRFPDWRILISDRLREAEFGAGRVLKQLEARPHVTYDSRLHLSVSMRSYRAESVSQFTKQVLDIDRNGARSTLEEIQERYPIVLTRNLEAAKQWLRKQARGSERYGIVVSSQANRLKPLAIDVRLKPNPVHWFLADHEDVRSSYYLEDAAREFDIQGLELDWVCVTWDADFRHSASGWSHHSFRGKKWQRINKPDRKRYLKNAYRVLLTRARQGMVIVVPKGDPEDPTRDPSFYDPTFDYLRSVGIRVLD